LLVTTNLILTVHAKKLLSNFALNKVSQNLKKNFWEATALPLGYTRS